jgi:hypothetical protein
MEKAVKESGYSTKDKKNWRYSKSVDDWTKSLSVEKLSNKGYLLCVNVYGTNADGKYKDITKKYYSETNPLEDYDGNDNDPIGEMFDLLVGNKQ